MRILLIIKNFDFGGAENHVRELANLLERRGDEVYVIARNGRQSELLKKNIRFIPLRFRFVIPPLHVILLSCFLVKNKIEVIHAHQRLPIHIATLAGIATGVPVIATVHGRTRFDLRSWISRRFTDRLIFVSREVLEVSAKLDEIKTKSVVIPNWVFPEEIHRNKIPFSVSYISRVDRKHSSLILMIIRKVISPLAMQYPKLTFRIIGEGESLPLVQEEAEKLNLGLDRKVCIVSGFVPDIKEVIRRSELVMGVGRVALEALACGVPVLSVNRNRLGEIISKSNYHSYKINNFVSVGSPCPDEKNLLRILTGFFYDREYRISESGIIRDYVLKDFDPDILTGRIRNLYYSSCETEGYRIRRQKTGELNSAC